MNNYLYLITNLNIYNKLKEAGNNAFLFALEGYSVGYPAFSLNELSNLDGLKYLLINRILTPNDIDSLRLVLKDMKDIKGIVFEDIGVFDLVKELNLDIFLIYFQNHAGTNYETINFWLEQGIDSCVVSNEITKEEIEEITKKVIKPVTLIGFGHNQVMYSRRSLLSNFQDFTNISRSNLVDLDTGKDQFISFENDYGTVFYTKEIYNYLSLSNLNFKYIIINTVLLSMDEVMQVCNNQIDYPTSEGFLNTKTIFKVGKKDE